jgi:hypothetical protein
MLLSIAVAYCLLQSQLMPPPVLLPDLHWQALLLPRPVLADCPASPELEEPPELLLLKERPADHNSVQQHWCRSHVMATKPHVVLNLEQGTEKIKQIHEPSFSKEKNKEPESVGIWVVAVVMYIGALRALFAEAALGVSASTDTDTE